MAKYIYHEAIVKDFYSSSIGVQSVPSFKLYILFIASKGILSKAIAFIASSVQDIQQNKLPDFSKFNQRGGNNA